MAMTAAVAWAPVQRRSGLLRHSSADAWLIAASLLHAGLLVVALLWLPRFGWAGLFAGALILAVALCWSSNTVAHNHLHSPLFRSRRLNRFFSLFLSVSSGIPQSVWRACHLWHHAGEPVRHKPRLSRAALPEILAIAALWLFSFWFFRTAFLCCYLPGLFLGLGLCRLQGDMEHALDERPARGVSYYGALYNKLWFNDGYHAEHHAWPAEHWTRLPARRAEFSAPTSDAPPHFRWIEVLRASALCALERLALANSFIQTFVLRSHARALGELLAGLGFEPRRVAIVGGGLFPRSLIVLRQLLPAAAFTVIDKSAHHVARARDHLAARGIACEGVEFRVESFDGSRHTEFDLVVTPLAFVGSERELERSLGRTALISHAFLWRRRGDRSKVVSWLLLKRVNLTLGRRR